MYLKRNVITKLCKQLLINILNVDYLQLFFILIEYKMKRELRRKIIYIYKHLANINLYIKYIL